MEGPKGFRHQCFVEVIVQPYMLRSELLRGMPSYEPARNTSSDGAVARHECHSLICCCGCLLRVKKCAQSIVQRAIAGGCTVYQTGQYSQASWPGSTASKHAMTATTIGRWLILTMTAGPRHQLQLANCCLGYCQRLLPLLLMPVLLPLCCYCCCL
jgi:hypothetical protein